MATDIDRQKKDRKDQKIVLTNILCGCVLLFCFGVIAAYYPFPKPHLPTLLDRLHAWMVDSFVVHRLRRDHLGREHAIQNFCYQSVEPKRHEIRRNTFEVSTEHR